MRLDKSEGIKLWFYKTKDEAFSDMSMKMKTVDGRYVFIYMNRNKKIQCIVVMECDDKN